MPNLLLCVGLLGTLVVATLLASLIVRMRFPLPQSSRRLGCIDGLRGYLALFVVAHHFVIWTRIVRFGRPWELPDFPLFRNLGSAGVTMFFMTTGLVFYPRIIAGFEKTSWRPVYISRVFRLIPLITFSVLMVTALIIYRTGGVPDKPFLLPSLVWISSYSQPDILGYVGSPGLNARVLWSLKYEWLFYLTLLPIMAIAADALRSLIPRWFIPVTVAAFFILYRILVPIDEFSFYVPLFAVGMIAFEIQERGQLRRALQGRWMSLVAIASVVASMSVFANHNALVQLVADSFFFVCVACGNTMFGVLKTRGALVLGECSFGIYLLHGIVLDILFTELSAVPKTVSGEILPLVLVAVAGVVVCISAATYLAIERPAITGGRNLSAWLTGYRARLDDPELEIAP